MNTKFRTELEDIINRNSLENGSDTPDWILADYLIDCLKAYDKSINSREWWYGRTTPSETGSPGSSKV